jgi:hypothetical protein
VIWPESGGSVVRLKLDPVLRKQSASIRADAQFQCVTWVGIDADTKLVVSYLVGGRDGGWAKDFMEDCAKRIRNRFCKVHQTLRVTPAMESGLTNQVWSLAELVGLLNGKTLQIA